MELAENFFSQKSVIARKRSVTPFFGAKRPLPPPPKKNCLSSEANIGLFLQNFNNGSKSQLRSISFISSFRFITHVRLSYFYCLGHVHLLICQKSPPYFVPWLISLCEQPVHLHELLPSEMIFFVGMYVF